MMTVPLDLTKYSVSTLRVQGQSDEQIALALGLAPHVVQAVPLPRPSPSRQRAVQHNQLMSMAQALMPRVEKGEPEAITLMLKVMQREANLLGLDAPKEVISHNFNTDFDGMTAEELANVPTIELKRRVLMMTAMAAEDATLSPAPEPPEPPESPSLDTP